MEAATQGKIFETVLSVVISALLIIGTVKVRFLSYIDFKSNLCINININKMNLEKTYLQRYRMLILPWIVYTGVQLVIYAIIIFVGLIVSVYLLLAHGVGVLLALIVFWIIFGGLFG